MYEFTVVKDHRYVSSFSKLLLLLILINHCIIQSCDCQYIAHLNGQGLIGNITFETNLANNELTIEAIIEDIRPTRIKSTTSATNESISSDHQSVPILFDWKLHTNQLTTVNAIQSCKQDDLGNVLMERETKSNLLVEGKQIALNTLNTWKVELDAFLAQNKARNLGSLIWGRSLSVIYHSLDATSQQDEKTNSRPFATGLNEAAAAGLNLTPTLRQPGSTTNKFPPREFASVLKTPSLKPVISTPAPIQGSKPLGTNFAPRPKPNISGRFKTITSTPGPLPKPESLISIESSSDDTKIFEKHLQQINSTQSDLSTRINNDTSQGYIKGDLIGQVNSTSDVLQNNTSKDDESAKAAASAALQFNLRKQQIYQKAYGQIRLCANIIDTREVKTVEAAFETSLAGKIVIRGNEDDTSMIMANLYHVKSKISTRHDWKILASDILDDQNHDEKCKHLHILFDPNNQNDTQCSRSDSSQCRMGDLTKKHGSLQVAGFGRNTKATYIDMNLPLSALAGSRSLYLAIYDVSASTSALATSSGSIQPTNNGLIRSPILSCARLRPVETRFAEAHFSMDGVRGSIKMQQTYSMEPTLISYDLFGLEGNMKHIEIRELPLPSRKSSNNVELCGSLGKIFDPLKVASSYSDQNLPDTFDKFPVGLLSKKFGELTVLDAEYEDHYKGQFVDLTMQLFGPQTIIGRSIVINKNNDQEPWVCANLEYAINERVIYAAANFYYPVVGRIQFQQLADKSNSETGILIDVYNPNYSLGSQVENHQWAIHLKPAMGDFYNWSERCYSVGEIFDPLQVGPINNNNINNNNLAAITTNTDQQSSGKSSNNNNSTNHEASYSRQCQTSVLHEPLRCRLGDLTLKSGFKLSLHQSHMNKTRYYYTDMFVPLSGLNSILGKSVVIYDENSPTQRGNRLACSTIKAIHPLKGSVKSWTSGPSIPSAVKGSISFEQKLEARPTSVRIDLNGFNGNVENYAIHNVWTVDDREFPCSNDSLYDIYDPYDNENSLKIPPSAHYGALATDDRVKVGDLSRKYGTFEGQQAVSKSLIDLNSPLFAPKSIIGRSIILRASVNDFRWVCGNIELDFERDFSRQIIAIASFDEPRSKVSGYVRFFQLEHKDGSLSDTFIHIDLKLQTDSNGMTIHELSGGPSSQQGGGHNWAIFVNQVGEDAFITADEVRCIAAGFKWNPYLAQDTLESYQSSCNPTTGIPEACAMGDLGQRHGPLTLGPNNRRTISDANLPLTGNYSIMGRSLVIFDSKKPGSKLACANIFPDTHLKSNVVIKRTPSFTVARFVEQMRLLLGATEWLLIPDLKATKSIANGECVQMTLHFYGQKAYQMQTELNSLVSLGTLKKSTKFGTAEKISTHFKLCRLSETTSSTSTSTSNLRGHSISTISSIGNKTKIYLIVIPIIHLIHLMNQLNLALRI